MKLLPILSCLLVSCAATTKTTTAYPDGRIVTVESKGGVDPNGASIAEAVAGIAVRYVIPEK